MFREVEKMQKMILGEKHANTLNSKYWIATCFYAKQQFPNAEQKFIEVEKLQKEVLGEKHSDTLNSKHRIATCLYAKQHFHNAEQVLEK